jgi:predicted nucleic acid-binding protein
VDTWSRSVDQQKVFLSVMLLGEVLRGIERLLRRDPPQAQRLTGWLTVIKETHRDRILPITEAIAEEWGRVTAKRTASPTDALLVATAKVHALTLVTRNVRHVSGLGVPILNPFEPAARNR